MNTHHPIAALPHGTATPVPDHRDFLQKSAAGVTKMAEQGLMAMSPDLALWGGSEGQYRVAASA